MNRLAHRKKQRREYLKKKGKAYTLIGGGTILVVPAVVLILSCIVMFAWCVIEAIRHVRTDVLGAVVGTTVMALCSLALLAIGIGTVRDGRNQIHTPYVPPVTPETLPAEEVLVRAASQPSATRETLLRPATGDAQKSAEQLLRATNGTKTEQP